MEASPDSSPADQRWPWWPLLPLYPYNRKRTLVRELIPDQLWSFEQLQGVFYVAVPIRMTVVRVRGGLMLYASAAPTGVGAACPSGPRGSVWTGPIDCAAHGLRP